MTSRRILLLLALIVFTSQSLDGCGGSELPLCDGESVGNECETSDECSNERQCFELKDGKKNCMYRCEVDRDCYEFGFDLCYMQESTDQGSFGYCGKC